MAVMPVDNGLFKSGGWLSVLPMTLNDDYVNILSVFIINVLLGHVGMEGLG